jgi:polysaccharide biosynthesis transport protein
MPDREGQIDIREYLRIVLKRRWTVMALFTIVFFSTLVHTFTATPIYRATALIVIEKENPNLMSIQEVMAVDATGSDYYQTQYKIVESRAVAREVIRRLDLGNSPEFFPEPKDDVVSKTKQWFAQTLAFWKEWVQNLLRTGKESGSDHQSLAKASSDSGLVSEFIARISVEPVSSSRLVDVSVEAMNPKLSARMANTLVRVYIDRNLETKLQAAKDAVKWLADRIDEERQKVEEAENALLQYKEVHGIITGFSSDAEKITAQKLASLNQQVIEAEARRVEAETRYRQAVELEDAPDMLDAIPEVLANALVKEIKTMEVGLYTRMSELSKKYGSQHPKMLAIESELADLKERKATEIMSVINSLRNEFRLAVAREESFKGALAQQTAQGLEMNKKAVQYGVLQRQVESARNMYELLIKRFKETSLTEEMKTGNVRIIDRAEVPGKPVKPNKKRNTVLGLVLGLILGMGMAFFMDYLDNTVKIPDEVKEYFGIPYLGPVPAVSLKQNGEKMLGELISVHSPKSTFSESIRGIRTGIVFSAADQVPQTILVTSAGPSEGKTICAANLAVTMAQDDGSRILLIDCDMRRPRIHKLFEINKDAGLSSALVGSSELKDVILPTDIENMSIIPCGPIPPNPSEILGSKRMHALLQVLKKNYTRIIIDSPPITAVTDAVILASNADGIVLVIRSGSTPRQIVGNGLAKLKSVNAHILGAVLNGVELGRDSYYYHQYYYYYGDKESKKSGRKKRKA